MSACEATEQERFVFAFLQASCYVKQGKFKAAESLYREVQAHQCLCKVYSMSRPVSSQHTVDNASRGHVFVLQTTF